MWKRQFERQLIVLVLYVSDGDRVPTPLIVPAPNVTGRSDIRSERLRSYRFRAAVFIPIVPPGEPERRVPIQALQPLSPRLQIHHQTPSVAVLIRVGIAVPLDAECHEGRQDVEAHIVKRIMS